jgi:hypothetical protein
MKKLLDKGQVSEKRGVHRSFEKNGQLRNHARDEARRLNVKKRVKCRSSRFF